MAKNISLVTYLDAAIQELAKPLETVLEDFPETESDGTALLMGELAVVALIFAHADFAVSEEEVEVLSYFCGGELDKDSLAQFSGSYTELCEKFLRAYPGNRLSIDHPPTCIRYLQIYDRENGTEYAEMGREMFFRLASFMVRADSKETSTENITLLNFQETLHREDEEVSSESS